MRSQVTIIIKADILTKIGDNDNQQQGNTKRTAGCHNSILFKAESIQIFDISDIEIITVGPNEDQRQYLKNEALIQQVRAVMREVRRQRGIGNRLINRELIIDYSEEFRPVNEQQLLTTLNEIVKR